MLSFSVAAAGGDIHLKGLTVDGSPSGTAFDNRIVRELRLYRDSISAANLLDTSNGGYIAAEKLAFDGAIDVTVSANSTQKFIVTASLVDDATQVGKTLQIGLSDIKLEDTSKNPVPVTSLPLISSRIATLAAGGKLFFEPESSDVSINSSKNILAGAVSPLLVAYKITATNEPIKIKDIIIRGTGTDFEKAVSEVIILGPDKTTEIARKSVSTSTINLNDMQYVVSPGSQNIYLKVVTRKIGKDEAGIQTGDLKVSLQIQSAE